MSISKTRMVWLLAALAAAAVGGASRLVAQVARPGVTADPAPALLEEVRALRREVGELAGVSVRAQLMIARLQLEDQRITYLDRRRDAIATRRRDAQRQRLEYTSILKDLETRLSESTGDERGAAEKALAQMKINLQQVDAAETALRSEESQLMGAIAAAQERWTQFNARLDELERALPQR